MTLFRADLHMHSHFSDGSHSPFKLIDLAKEKGLSAISITDHDIYAAYSDDVMEYAKSQGVFLLPGVEFSCYFKGSPVHILAYNIDPTPLLLGFCDKHTRRRQERFDALLSMLEKKGVKVKREQCTQKEHGNLGRVFLAQKLVQWGVNSSVKEAFSQYLADRHLKNLNSAKFTIEETVSVIKASGGKAFLAHPHLIRKKSLIYEILDSKLLGGIECFYGFFPSYVDHEWEKLARTRNLLTSGGSDFHGEGVTAAVMGSSWSNREATEAIFPGKLES